MKRRIRSIFLLMTCCILGINVFQGYWLYTTYSLNVQEFSHTVREALSQTLRKQQLTKAQRLFMNKLVKPGENDSPPSYSSGLPSRIVVQRIKSDKKTPGSDGVMTHVRVKNNQANRIIYSFRRQGDWQGDTVIADTLARDISRMLIVNWSEEGGFNLKRIDSLYRQELKALGVESRFVLDTINLKPRENGVTVFNGFVKPRGGYAIRTAPVPVNPVQGKFIQASFETPAAYILKKMGWLLGGSVLLLILTTGCFVYMLSTILRQKRLSEIKNDFINNMTHELKTPIATVSAAVEAMQHFGALNDPQKTKTYLNISQNELSRLSDLVEKVLNMAAEEQRELVLHPDLIQPADLIQDLVEQHKLKAQKPVDFDISIPADDRPVYVDKVHVRNVINNLIDNAIKYSLDRVTIQIRSQRDAQGWQITVSDDGIGIPKTYQEAIFDRFFRVPTGNLHPVKGFGLGLYYVRQVVEKHGGTIEVWSETGQSASRRGSEFTLWFPD